MVKTFKRLRQRNRYLSRRRERMPMIRAVETTFDDIDRQTLSPARSISPISAKVKRSEKDECVSDDDDVMMNNVVTDGCDFIDNNYEMKHNSDENTLSEIDVDNVFNDDINNVTVIHDDNVPNDGPTCSHWATEYQQQVEEAEKEYESTVYQLDIGSSSENSKKSFSKTVSITELGT